MLLLVDLTNVSQTELQKLIAFEDAFQRTFNFIHAEGGLAEGGIVVQDCLSLLANLIRHSASNQSLFRESGCIPRLVDVVQQSVTAPPDENAFSRQNREKNSWGLLAVLRLFLEHGEVGTKQNQEAFSRAGLVQLVLRLAFDPSAAPPIRTSALKTCAAMIIHNPPLQESFAALQVPLPVRDEPATNGTRNSIEPRMVYVIEALLDLVLAASPSRPLELRSSACGLIKAYFSGHQRIKYHFLQRAIAGYTEGEEDTANVLSTLMNGPQGAGTTDPARFAFASDILSQLVYDEPQAKDMLMSVREGDADKGEDVVSSIQMLSGHLLSSLQNDFDPQISIAYLTLLTTFLFDAPEAINDCLAEGSALMGVLISITISTGNSQVANDPLKSLLPGLCAMLLGTIYEFSTKDSPIPRRTLHPLLLSKLGRQKYFDALAQFRSHPAIRDFELLADSGAPELDLAYILFDPAFVDWFKDEYGRLKRAIDRQPGIEVIRKTEVGVDRDILDDLREQLKAKDDALQQMEKDGVTTRQRADSIAADYRRELQGLQSSQRTLEAEVERIKRVNEALQRDHEAEMQRVQGELRSQIAQARLEARNQAETLQQQHAREVERVRGEQGASLASERSLWEDKTRKAAELAAKELSAALEKQSEEHGKALGKAVQEHREAFEKAEEEHGKGISELKARVQQHAATIRQREDALQDHEKASKGLKQEHQSVKGALVKLQSEHDEAKKTIEKLDKEIEQGKRLQEGLQEVNSKAMSRVKVLEEEAKQRERRIKSLTEECDSQQGETDGLQQRIKELEQEVEGLLEELAAERKGYGELEAELEKAKKRQSQEQSQNKGASKGEGKKMAQLEKEIAAIKGEMEKEKEETKKARSELEDMLMVLSDLEGKRDGYRERLKKLGEDVTDDEEDEEDEEDEDEEDEEED